MTRIGIRGYPALMKAAAAGELKHGPIVNIIPLQLLAYHIADLRGSDVDQPRNPEKSAMVE